MSKHVLQPAKKPTLRSFITITISLIVTVVLLGSIFFYYQRTAAILRRNSQDVIVGQLEQANRLITEQIDSIDSMIPLILANNQVLKVMENGGGNADKENLSFQIERQISFLYYSSPLSGKNYIDSIYLIQDDGSIYHAYTSGKLEAVSECGGQISSYMDPSWTRLICFTLSSDKESLYFARNLFNSSTGRHMGIMALSVNTEKWIQSCAKGLDPEWFIALFHPQTGLLSSESQSPGQGELEEALSQTDGKSASFQELEYQGQPYYMAAQTIPGPGLTCAVAAPRDLLLKDLNQALKSYLIFLAFTIPAALSIAIAISRAVTRPIDKMVTYLSEISGGVRSSLPPVGLYQEFEGWANAFNEMLQKLDASYNDNFQKQLLLKNAEIQALQAQMDPHFMFNILNTIAWKAQFSDNEEIYQMVVSLGELLRMNTVSRDHPFVPLKKEMEYVKLYLYLQQMRFEDKISCSIQILPELMEVQIPCFCIQPLVENAIVHGLEPKKGKGKLAIQVFRPREGAIEICIADNGIGFQEIPDLQSIASSDQDSHTHIGLRNLDKRLELLFGPSARLNISSEPNVSTILSFTIPESR